MNRRSFLSALALGLALAGQRTEAGSTYSMAVVPQFPAGLISRDWMPILAEVGRQAGITLQLRHYLTIPDFEAAFLKGEPDFAYMNPYHVVMANKAAGYLPIVHDRKQRLTGILVVRKDAIIRSLGDLDGAQIAFPAPNAFGASLYMRALLTEVAKVRFKPNYLTTHSNVYRHVLTGRALAGGAISQTLEKESPEMQGMLRVLYETPPASPHPVAAHPRVPARVREAVQNAFLRLGEDPAFAAALRDIQIPNPGRTDYGDYAPLARLGLERYVSLEKD
jgi:phosphonate transport system substrate-binding protein